MTFATTAHSDGHTLWRLLVHGRQRSQWNASNFKRAIIFYLFQEKKHVSASISIILVFRSSSHPVHAGQISTRLSVPATRQNGPCSLVHDDSAGEHVHSLHCEANRRDCNHISTAGFGHVRGAQDARLRVHPVRVGLARRHIAGQQEGQERQAQQRY